ncbi:MAG: uroporphyrinogen-III synthase [Acidiferrobacterales bacterium]|nr:uroporphyrinogen-III synthase [Acidiferrobacterales bacterium]
MVSTNAATLSGSAVIVTRPGARGRELVSELSELGARAMLAEVLIIELLPKRPELREVISQLEQSTLLVFVSIHAVSAFAEAMSATDRALPAGIQCAAIGAATASALQHHGMQVDFVPSEEMNSEALLKMFDQTCFAKRPVVIFRGQKGRELLANSFSEWGATVIEIECYRRQYKPRDLAEQIAALEAGERRAVICTSVDLLEALLQSLSLPQQQVVFRSDLIVFSERIAAAARKLGFHSQFVVAPTTNNEGLIRGLMSIHANSRYS